MSDEPPHDQQPKAGVCAECKRLKLRCDRRVPCSSCSRRGCEHVCPDGTLPRGRFHPNRMLLSDSTSLQDVVDTMRSRISDLEDAIALLRSSEPEDGHVGENSEEEHLDKSNAPLDQLSSLLGTLTLGKEPHWFGPNASSDFLLFRKQVPNSLSRSTRFLAELVSVYPFTNTTAPDSWVLLLALPSRRLAYSLLDKYSTVSWIFGSLSSRELRVSILDVLYSGEEAYPSTMDGLTMHDLAVLFSVFAIAQILDTGAERNEPEARRYCSLASLALVYDPVMQHPTLQGIRALHLLCWALHLADDQDAMTIAYNVLGIISQLCRALGLHRNDTGWRLSKDEIHWDIAVFDLSASVNLGRPPPFFSPAHFDAAIPVDDSPAASDYECRCAFVAWCHTFVRTCILPVIYQVFAATSVTYSTVMRLDRLIRKDLVPTIGIGNVDESNRDVQALQQATILLIKHKLLLYLHRSFFARGMSCGTLDPLKGPFHQSILSAFRAAICLATTVRTIKREVPLSIRLPYFWSAAFSASVVLGSIVVKSPKCALARGAYIEFNKTFKTLEDVSQASGTVARVMPSLLALQGKVRAAWCSAQPVCHAKAVTLTVADLDELEMAFIYGRTLVVDSPENDFDRSGTLPIDLTGGPVPAIVGGPYSWDDLSGMGQDSMPDTLQDTVNLDAAWETFMDEMGLIGEIPML